jgi:hypothetical protein
MNRITNLHHRSKALSDGVPAREVSLTLPCRVVSARFNGAATKRQAVAINALLARFDALRQRLNAITV